MVMPELSRQWTREEVLNLPDDRNRYELVDGELLVSPSPRWLHQFAVGELYALISRYVREQHVGVTTFSPADLSLGSGQLLQPDLFVASLRADGRVPLEWSEVHVPLLVAEVLSLSTARHDRMTKRRRYQRSGVPEFWIVDTDARVFERWTPSNTKRQVLDRTIRWRPEGVSDALEIDLPAYFRDVWGER